MLDDIGTIVTIGDQQFYTIGTEGDNVKLLSMYNLYVGGVYDGTVRKWTAYGDEATGKQHPDMKGSVSGQTARYGVTKFSDIDSTYTGSIVEGYVNDYKTILERDYGVEVEEARLITKDELESEQIGCSSDDYTCEGAPEWIYSTSYWSGSVFNASDVWFVTNIAYFSVVTRIYNSDCGVRPVIVIPKEQIVTPRLIEFSVRPLLDKSYQALEGMTWREWIESKYNTDGFYIDEEYDGIEFGSSGLESVRSNDLIIEGRAYYMMIT